MPLPPTDLYLFVRTSRCALTRSFFYRILLKISFHSASITGIIEAMLQKTPLEFLISVVRVNTIFLMAKLKQCEQNNVAHTDTNKSLNKEIHKGGEGQIFLKKEFQR